MESGCDLLLDADSKAALRWQCDLEVCRQDKVGVGVLADFRVIQKTAGVNFYDRPVKKTEVVQTL